MKVRAARFQVDVRRLPIETLTRLQIEPWDHPIRKDELRLSFLGGNQAGHPTAKGCQVRSDVACQNDAMLWPDGRSGRRRGPGDGARTGWNCACKRASCRRKLVIGLTSQRRCHLGADCTRNFLPHRRCRRRQERARGRMDRAHSLRRRRHAQIAKAVSQGRCCRPPPASRPLARPRCHAAPRFAATARRAHPRRAGRTIPPEPPPPSAPPAP